MNDPEHIHLLRAPVTLQAIPDGADNVQGLLAALLRSAASEPPCADHRTRVGSRAGTNRRSRLRAAWLFLRYGGRRPRSKLSHLNLEQIREK
jgi:hypothetical protein